MIEETLDFMKMQCLRYDNLTSTDQAENLIRILDKTKELERCLQKETSEDLEDFLKEYAQGQRLSGIFILDREGNPVESVYMDDETYEDWEEILKEKNVMNVIDYPQKSYIARKQEADGRIYDYAAVAQSSGEYMIFCYIRRIQSESDEMSISLDNLLSGYRLEMDGRMLITDGTTILSSNEGEVQGQDVSAYSLISDHITEISADKMSFIKEDGATYLARSSKFRNYYLYVFFPARSVFQKRSVIIAYALIFYVGVLLLVALIIQREMQNANQLKMKFLRQMSHDIRTPINGIRGMIQIGNSYPDDLQKQKECRDKIWDASGFLMDLVNDVLDMGKLESGEIKLEEKPFHLQKLIHNEIEVMEAQARERKVTLKIGKMEGEHWSLIGSPLHIQRILTNILSNAIKYNQENGSVILSCVELPQKTEPGTVFFQFICEDTGIGMSREFQKRMFDQFTQENASGEVSYHGTGLGLTIVKNLVQEMNGEIQCKSEQGKGTVFSITIPLIIDRRAEQLEEIVNTERGEMLQGVSVLLVEDNELNMEIAEFILEEEGAVIQKAWNGHEAVEIFKDSKPGEIQVILMDVMMPVMDGEQAAQEIRALNRPDAKTVPIIAMTANAFEDDVDSAIASGMNAHIAKPIDVEQIKRVLQIHLR
jgi:signal transduction histidine kinase/CheY-like chemotaxis protein